MLALQGWKSDMASATHVLGSRHKNQQVSIPVFSEVARGWGVDVCAFSPVVS